MKTIRIVLITFLITPFFYSCGGEDVKEKYNKDLAQFKADKLTLITEKFNLLMSYEKVFGETNEVFAPELHKECKISIDDTYGSRPMNTIYVENRFFAQEYDHPFELSTYNNLCDIRRLINGEKLSLYDDASGLLSYDYLQQFKKYCDDFINAKYIIIHGGIESSTPSLNGDGYSPGYMKGLVALYDFQTKKPIDNFLFEATSSMEIDYLQEQDPVLVLMNDFLNNISFTISEEINARYTLEESSVIPFLTISEKAMAEYKAEKLK